MFIKIDSKNRAISAFMLLFVLLCTMIALSAYAGTSSKPDAPAFNCISVDASELQCKMRGTWDGIELVSRDPISGDFEVKILADGTITGSYSGIISGTISGCIDSRGNFQAKGIGSGPDIFWSGRIQKSEAVILGSGKWFITSIGKGTWSGKSY
ncbi:hypothetical protein ES705_32606 [subsurface metagenome]